MKNKLVLLVAMLFTTLPALAKTKAYTLEVNMGPLFIEYYDQVNNGALTGCPATSLLRDCLKSTFARYVREGATAVRFLFYLAGPNSPIQDNGQVDSRWKTNLANALQDMKDAGFQNVVPTPVWSNWGNGQIIEVFDACENRRVSYRFYKASPFPFEIDSDFPYGHGNDEQYDNSYKCAPANPIFVGWPVLYGIMETLIAQIKSTGLGISEFDIENEINVQWFPVMARRIYDPTAPVSEANVYGRIRSLMTKYGFNADLVTYSVALGNTSQTGFDCQSVYGDSGRLGPMSALYAAIQGQPFGHGRNWNVRNGIICDGNKQGMAQLPLSQPLPLATDIHAYSCVINASGVCNPSRDQDVDVDTQVLYNAAQKFMEVRGNPFGLFILGETFVGAKDTDGRLCENHGPPTAPAQIQSAFVKSKLFTTAGRTPAQNIIRPWINVASPCEGTQVSLSPPYDSMMDIGTPPPPVNGQFSASPNPIPVTAGETLGITTINWNFPSVAWVEVHVNSPSGPLFAAGGGVGNAQTGKWVQEGTQFFLQNKSTGATLATLVARLMPVVTPPPVPRAELKASPEVIPVNPGQTLGKTTIQWSAPGIQSVEVHVGSPTGPLFAAGGSTGSAITGDWVTHGMVFYLIDRTTKQTLGTVTVTLKDRTTLAFRGY